MKSPRIRQERRSRILSRPGIFTEGFYSTFLPASGFAIGNGEYIHLEDAGPLVSWSREVIRVSTAPPFAAGTGSSPGVRIRIFFLSDIDYASLRLP